MKGGTTKFSYASIWSCTCESSSSRKWYFSWLKIRHTNPVESDVNGGFHCIWSILWPVHEGKISKLNFKTSCMTLAQKLLIHMPFYHKRVKTGLRSRFYLNCSHILLRAREVGSPTNHLGPRVPIVPEPHETITYPAEYMHVWGHQYFGTTSPRYPREHNHCILCCLFHCIIDVKGVLYSMLAPDLLGLTAAVWNIVGQCF